MTTIDWVVLVSTLLFIVVYGLYQSRRSKNIEDYFLSNRSMPWYVILLSIMGTQASAITFLSAPGQAYTDGMRFVQYYFGLPLAMVVLCITFVPAFSKLKVFTPYEFLQQRFDAKTRSFTSFLFLLSRGFSTGISVYAPSIILSSIFGWNIFITNILMGGILIIYTVSGGARAVAYTQQIQFIIIIIAMLLAGYFIIDLMPPQVGLTDALTISGASGKLNAITTGFTKNGFEWKDKYNLVSGLLGGFFLALSYFGTDQSQVGRYLTAKSDRESKLGLLMNGMVKIPMQFFILLIGAMLFSFYQFTDRAPVFFNEKIIEQSASTSYKDSLNITKTAFDDVVKQRQHVALAFIDDKASEQQKNIYRDSLQLLNTQAEGLSNNYKTLLGKADKSFDTNDTNYIFLYFVINNLPAGLVGLVIAVIFLASWGSIAAALNSLASSTVIDFHLRFSKKPRSGLSDVQDYKISKWYTFAWGVFSIIVAEFANRLGSLVEAVNVLGSLFYGVILGIFLVAFYCRSVKGNAVFISAIISEIFVITLFVLDSKNIIGLGFLWLNVAGALAVPLLAYIIQLFDKNKASAIAI